MNHSSLRRRISRILAGAVTLTLVLGATVLAMAGPAWWTSRSVLSENTAHDYSMANQGQAKWFALKAEEELRAKLPESFNGPILGTLPTGDNYKPINQGQLKNLVKPLYDRIQEAAGSYPGLLGILPEGMTGTYPWTAQTDDDANYAPVNLGQMKYALSFDFNRLPPSDISVVATDSDASEDGNDPGTFTITRTGDTSMPLTVTFQLSGTATEGVDYLPVGSEIVIPAGYSSVDVTIQPLTDFVSESTETVILTVTGCSANCDIGNAAATVSITDGPAPDPHLVTVQVARSLACENSGNPGAFAIYRTGGHLAAPLTVKLALSGTAEEGTDYQSLPDQVTIPANADFGTVVIQPLADGNPNEVPETVILQAQSGANYTIGDPASATVNIFESCVGTDSIGTDFWLLFSDTGMENFTEEELVISGPFPTTATVTIPGHGTQTYAITPGGSTRVKVPLDLIITDNDAIQNKGIHVTADKPVSVYGINYDESESDAFVAYSTPMLGMTYRIIARPSLLAGFQFPSQLGIVATENNTLVTITPSPTANFADHPGTSQFTKLLQQGETYQIQSGDSSSDVTGTLVTSDKPIGVFAGAQMARVPTSGQSAGNQLVEEQLPVNVWARQALGFPLATRLNGDSYRVVAAYNNTVVTVNGAIAAVLQAGQFYDTVINRPVAFRANNPIQVAQYSNGTSFDGVTGDPFMLLLPPTGHYLNSYIVSTPMQSEFTSHYLSLFVDQSALQSTYLDGQLVAQSLYQPIAQSGYYGAQIEIQRGTHTISSSKAVGVQVYGFGEYDGYGYIGGVANFPLAAVPDSINVALNSSKMIDVLANDVFSDRNNVVVTIVSNPTHGSATVTSDKKISYTPEVGYSGNAELTYKVEENGYQDTTTVTLTINPPVAVDDKVMMCSTSDPAVVQVLQNDSSPNGAALSVLSAGGANYGSVSVNADNTVTYTRFSDAEDEPDSFNYIISDTRGATATARVSVYVANAVDDSANVFEGSSVTLPVLNNDSFSGSATVTDVTQGNSGTVTISADGHSVVYEPTSTTGSQGSDSFTYSVQDGDCSKTATVYITLNYDPVAITTQPQSQTVLIGGDTSLAVVATGSEPLTYQWRDENGWPIFDGSAVPGGATISGATTATLTLSGFQTAENGHSYYVTVSNPAGAVDSAKATVNVADTVPPIITAQPVSRNAIVGSTVQFSVSVISAPPTTYQWYKNGVAISGQTASTWTLQNVQMDSAGTYSVTVHNNYGNTPSDVATLTVSQLPVPPVVASPSRSGSLPATVKLTVPGYPDAVIHYTIDGTLPTATSPVYSSPITISSKTTISAFATRANCTDGGYTVVTIGDINAPVAVTDRFGFSQDDGGRSLDILGNDINPTGGALQVSILQSPLHGTVGLGTSDVAYTPTAGFFGVDEFTYAITDNSGNKSAATVTIFVNKAENSAPVSTTLPWKRLDTYHVVFPVGTHSCTINSSDLLSTGQDYDNDSLLIYSIDMPEKGTFSGASAGQLDYIRTSGKYGDDSFQYVILDANGGYDTGTIVVGQADTDGDGMPDEWENANGLSVGVDDSADDTDSDGLPNLAEYTLRTNPHSPDNPLNLQSMNITDGFEEIPLSISQDVPEDTRFVVFKNGTAVETDGALKVVLHADGQRYLTLNTAFVPNGNYTIQLGVFYAKDSQSGWQTALGQQATATVNNLFTLDEIGMNYDGELVIQAILNTSVNGYSIDIYDDSDPTTLLTTLSGVPDGNTISQTWNLQYGNNVASGKLRCVFSFTSSADAATSENVLPAQGNSSGGSAVSFPKLCYSGKDVTKLVYRSMEDIANTFNDAGFVKRTIAALHIFNGGYILKADWDFWYLHKHPDPSAPADDIFDRTKGCPNCSRTVTFEGKCVSADELNYMLYGEAVALTTRNHLNPLADQLALITMLEFGLEVRGEPWDVPDVIARKVGFAEHALDLCGQPGWRFIAKLDQSPWPHYCKVKNNNEAVRTWLGSMAFYQNWYWSGLKELGDIQKPPFP